MWCSSSCLFQDSSSLSLLFLVLFMGFLFRFFCRLYCLGDLLFLVFYPQDRAGVWSPQKKDLGIYYNSAVTRRDLSPVHLGNSISSIGDR